MKSEGWIGERVTGEGMNKRVIERGMNERRTEGGMGKKGYLYTVSIVMLVIPLLLLILFYADASQTRAEDVVARVRCDELHYFVGDIERDLDRAMGIFGRRAAIYAIDNVVAENATMHNYTYHNCSGYVFEEDGAGAAIAELVMCGTLYGEGVSFMVNHTLPMWVERISVRGEEYSFDSEIALSEIEVLPYDAWDFAIVIHLNVTVRDMMGMCSFRDEDLNVMGVTSIIGLEDPLYPIKTNNQIVRYIDDCAQPVPLAGVACGSGGEGSASGRVVFSSKISDLSGYCGSESDIGGQILILDEDISCGPRDARCFNESSGQSFAAVVSYSDDDDFVDDCNLTIPWIAGVGKLDDETAFGGGYSRDPSCGEANITTGGCITLKNQDGCGIHELSQGCDDKGLGSCYRVSNVSDYPSICSGEAIAGPSFFDRLEGRLYLSQRYANASRTRFGEEDIGLETLVDIHQILDRGLDIDIYASRVDYLYWAGEEGESVDDACRNGSLPFRLDCRHAHIFELDAGAHTAGGSPPVSTIDTPSDGANLTCIPVELRGRVDDCDGSIAAVEVQIGEENFTASIAGGMWNYTWSPSETGIYAVYVRAVDNESIVERGPAKAVFFVSGCADGDNDPPPAPGLSGPLDGMTDTGERTRFFWQTVGDSSGIFRYHIQVDDVGPGFGSVVAEAHPTSNEFNQSASLGDGNLHWWRVRAQDGAGNWGAWSATWSFET